MRRLARTQTMRLAPERRDRLLQLRRALHRWRTQGNGAWNEWRRLAGLTLGGPLGDHAPRANRTLVRYDDGRVIDRYFQRIRELPRPLVCVVKHSAFARIAWDNRRLGIPTVACPANLEALDVGATLEGRSDRAYYLTALNLGDELRALAACDARLFLSSVETGLVNGLGQPAHYYPYRPVGQLEAEMQRVRTARVHTMVDPQLLVMLGSAVHPTTGESFRWFLQEAQRNGLPEGIKLMLCGNGAEDLAQGGTLPQGVEARGWVDQAELMTLLSRTCGVILPQLIGFGGLTRLAELSCAGVPTLVSSHAARAVDPLPPGVIPVEDTWPAWRAGIEQLLVGPHSDLQQAGAYAAWAQQQANPWPAVLNTLAPG
ncbi:MAG: hypothetical protein IPK16_16370 [Anaerolineales bacterium]|nr:hypothetical protein [Anaerolineales bacterium]